MRGQLTSRVIFLVGMAMTVPVFGGQIYGTIRTANTAVANEVVRVYCKNDSTHPDAITRTDEYGSYSVYVEKPGKCEIRVGSSKGVSVPVYADDVRHDLRLDGNVLRRD